MPTLTTVEIASLLFPTAPGRLSPYDRTHVATWLRKVAQRLEEGELDGHTALGLTCQR